MDLGKNALRTPEEELANLRRGYRNDVAFFWKQTAPALAAMCGIVAGVGGWFTSLGVEFAALGWVWSFGLTLAFMHPRPPTRKDAELCRKISAGINGVRQNQVSADVLPIRQKQL